jgi:hypothetical protein
VILRKRLVVGSILTPAALGILGLVWLDLRLRRAVSSTAMAVQRQDVAMRERLTETLTALTSSGSRASREEQWEAARWLSRWCADLGYESRIEEYERKGERWPNVVASRAPLWTEIEPVLATAHLDSISSDPQHRAPGADDNASGVAVLLEVARMLRAVETDRPVAFCFFSNEEVADRGSQAFAGAARRQNRHIWAAVNVDVVGYNLPARLVDWAAVTAQSSWRGRGRAVWGQVRNGVTALREGPDRMLVAGRSKHRWLVDQVGDALAHEGGLSVARLARDDCG